MEKTFPVIGAQGKTLVTQRQWPGEVVTFPQSQLALNAQQSPGTHSDLKKSNISTDLSNPVSLTDCPIVSLSTGMESENQYTKDEEQAKVNTCMMLTFAPISHLHNDKASWMQIRPPSDWTCGAIAPVRSANGVEFHTGQAPEQRWIALFVFCQVCSSVCQCEVHSIYRLAVARRLWYDILAVSDGNERLGQCHFNRLPLICTVPDSFGGGELCAPAVSKTLSL